MLPDIVEHSFSLKLSARERLFRFLSQLFEYDLRTWKTRYVLLVDEDIPQPQVLSALEKLRDQFFTLLKTPEDKLSNKILRLKVIAGLHSLLGRRGKPNESISRVLWQHTLALAFEVNDYTDNVNHEDRFSIVYILQTFFPSVYLNEPLTPTIDALTSFFSFISSKKLLGLPTSFAIETSMQLEYLTGSTIHEDILLKYMELLFGHFLTQDPREADHDFPATRQDQLNTLDTLIRFVEKHQMKFTRLAEVVVKWRGLIDEAITTRRTADDSAGRWKVNPAGKRTTIDETLFLDLRDVSWILDGLDPNPRIDDPYDLQDVLWMFEKDEGLDLWSIRKRLGRVLRPSGAKDKKKDVKS